MLIVNIVTLREKISTQLFVMSGKLEALIAKFAFLKVLQPLPGILRKALAIVDPVRTLTPSNPNRNRLNV